jgi:hypothetical protein
MAHNDVQAIAARIRDPALWHGFLTNHPTLRIIVQAWAGRARWT